MATRPIKISIIGDDSQLKKSLKSSAKRLEGFGKRVAKVGAQAGVAFAATAAAVGVASVNAYANFEKGLREVLTLLPDAGAEVFGQLSDQVKSFSREMGVLPEETIPALYQALSAGVDQNTVFDFLETAQRAARGGITDLTTSVDALTSVTNAYATSGMTAVEASDLLFTAVRLGKTDFSQLSSEIYKVAPIASAVGIEFGAVTAALANLTAQGTPTAQAATQLKAAFGELSKAGSRADVAFRDLAGQGMADFLAGGGTFEQVLLMLKDSADGAGASVLDMFGSIEAGQAILALTADGGAAFSETLAEMSASAGATDAAFATMDASLSASFDKIKSNLAVLSLEIGEKLAPYVEDATEFLIDGFRRLGPWVENAKAVVQEWADVFIDKVTPAVDKFKEVFSKVVDWVRTFIRENPHSALAALAVLVAAIVIPVVLGLALAFASLFSPVLFIVAGLALLAGGAVYAYENFETFRNIVDTVRDWMVNTLWPALKWVAEQIVIAFGAVVSYFQTTFLNHVQAVVDALVIAWQAVATFFMTYLWPTIETVLGYITDGFKALVSYFQTTFLNHVQAVVDALVIAWQAVADFFMTYFWPVIEFVLGYIVDAFWAVLRFFQNDFVPIVQTVVAAVIAAWQTVSSFFTETLLPLIQETIGLIVVGFQELVAFFEDTFLPAVLAVVDALVIAWQAVAGFFMEFLWPIIKAAFDGIVSVLWDFWDVVFSVYDLIGALFSGDFKAVWFRLRTLVAEVVDFIVNLFLFLPVRIWDASRGLIEVLANLVDDFNRWLFFKIIDIIQAIPDQIVEFLSGIADDMLTIGKNIGTWIIDGLIAAVRAAASAVADAVRSIIPDVGSIAGGIADSVGGFFKSMIPGLAHGGIVTSPTLAVIGEAGPEAVVPLNQAGSWGATTINITVNAGLGTDGHQVGSQIVSALKQWERSNGSLPLTISAA